MIRNFDGTSKNIDGSDLLDDEGKPGQHKKLIINVLLASSDDMNGDQKLKNWNLANKIQAGGDIDLSIDEISLIKKQAGKYAITLLYGQVMQLLESDIK